MNLRSSGQLAWFSLILFNGSNLCLPGLGRLSQEKIQNGQKYVTLLLDGNLLIVAVDGYMYGLDALTGKQIWFNEMTGFGTGVTSLVSLNGTTQNLAAAAAAANSSAPATTP